MPDRNKTNLISLIKYCQDIETLHSTYGFDYKIYEGNIGYQYSVSFCVEQIGELAKKLRDNGIAETVSGYTDENKCTGTRIIQ